MALYNAFGAMALDQSVMSTTPILKNILGALQATPYVYVVNNSTQLVSGTVSVSNFPTIQNVNVASAATPLFVDNAVGQTLDVNIASTPIVYAYQGAQSYGVHETGTPIVYAQIVNQQGAGTTVSVTNFPATQNVKIVDAATPLLVDNPFGQMLDVSVLATPYVYVVNQTAGGAASNVNVLNFPATQNVKITDAATPLLVDNPVGHTLAVRETATPVVVSYQGAPYNVNLLSTPIVVIANPSSGGVAGSVSVTNFPATQNVQVMNFATPQPVNIIQQATPLQVFVTSTPIVQLANTQVAVQNFPATQPVSVTNFSSLAFATPLLVNLIQQATPLQVTVTGHPATPVVQMANTQVAVNNFPATQPVSGSVSVSNFPGTQPVSGTVSVGNFPATSNVTIQQVATPVATYVTSTPVVSLANTQVAVNNFPASQNVAVTNFSSLAFATPLLVNLIQQATPIQVSVTSQTATPVVMAQLAHSVLNTNIMSTPIVYAQIVNQQGAGTSVSVTNFPGTQAVSGTVGVNNFPAVQTVAVATQSTPIAVWDYNTSTPVVAVQPSSTSLGAQNAIKSQVTFQSGSLHVASDGTFQGQQDLPITLWSSAAGYQATPLVLAAGRQIRVLSYAFTCSAACTVILTATPITGVTNLMLASKTGIPQALTNSYIQGGPYFIAANGGVSFPGSILGEAFTVPVATPLYIQTNGSNVGGHFTFVYI